MEKKFKCGMCGSESNGTPEACCDAERKDSKMENMEHGQKESETCSVCNVK